MSKRDVVIVDGVRTAFGTLGRTLRDFSMEKLGGIALKGLIEKTKVIEKRWHRGFRFCRIGHWRDLRNEPCTLDHSGGGSS